MTSSYNSKGYCAMQTKIKVRGFHLDVYQHVNNARYLEFLEEARWDGLENSESFQWLTAHNICGRQYQHQLPPSGRAG
jgi:thioesterase-3